ncbi:MAG: type IV pilin protein [Arenimonas sp.]
MKKSAGFTLIELMIVITVVTILVAIAVPSYNSQMRKSRRAEAKQILSAMQLEQEKWRASHATYGTSAAPPTASNVPIPNTSTYYNVTMTVGSNTATGYVYTATPLGDQLNDTCGTLGLTMTTAGVTKTPTTAGCW